MAPDPMERGYLDALQRSLDRLAVAMTDMRKEARDDNKVMHDRITAHSQRIERMVRESQDATARTLKDHDKRVRALENSEQLRKGARIVRAGILATGLTIVSTFLAAFLIGAAKKLGWIQ